MVNLLNAPPFSIAATKYIQYIPRVPHALSISSSELGLPHPLSRKRVCLPPPGTKEGVGYTLACMLGGGGVPIRTTGEKA
jgi:hypothetical protein